MPVALVMMLIIGVARPFGGSRTTRNSGFSGLQSTLLHRAQQGPLESRYAGVAEAMVLGWRGDLDPQMKATFRDSGIMHLLCVSGLHVGLMAALTGALLFWVNRERRGRIIRGSIQLIVIWGFTLITGAAPSTLRAALMFSLFIVADLIGRRTERLNLLALAAIVMLAIQPSLLFNISWQLSFAAVAGILLVQPLIGNIHDNILLQSAIVSMAATLATLPIMVDVFHRLPVYFLIANVLIVPWAAVILATSLLYIAIPCGLTAALVRGPLWVTDRVATWVSSLPYATVEGIDLTTGGIVMVTAAIILLLVAPRFLCYRQPIQ